MRSTCAGRSRAAPSPSASPPTSPGWRSRPARLSSSPSAGSGGAYFPDRLTPAESLAHPADMRIGRQAGAVILYGGWLLLQNPDARLDAPLSVWKKLHEYDTSY